MTVCVEEVGGRYLVWDADMVRHLRCACRIMGELIGPPKLQQSRLNRSQTHLTTEDEEEDGEEGDSDEESYEFVKALPLLLTEDEVRLILEKGFGVIVDSNVSCQSFEPSALV